MVTRSNDNYIQHKKDVVEILTSKYGDKRANIFINHYSSRYDTFNRSFIDWRLAFALMGDYFHIQNRGSKWYAFVGIGGVGKTTLAKNVCYFLDPQYNLKEGLARRMNEWVVKLGQFQRVKAKRALLLDEPDDTYHMSSKKGKILRRILGKVRQQQMCLAFCATDLNDLPNYIFRKLDGIFFMPSLGKFMYFKNDPKQKSYLLQEIRHNYAKEGRLVYIPKDVLDELNNIKVEENIQINANALRRMKDYSKLGRNTGKLMKIAGFKL